MWSEKSCRQRREPQRRGASARRRSSVAPVGTVRGGADHDRTGVANSLKQFVGTSGHSLNAPPALDRAGRVLAGQGSVDHSDTLLRSQAVPSLAGARRQALHEVSRSKAGAGLKGQRYLVGRRQMIWAMPVMSRSSLLRGV